MPAASSAFAVVTVNLWGSHGPVRARMADLGAWLAAEQPDVVLLQEVEAVGGVGQAQLLAEAAGFEHVATGRTGPALLGSLSGEGLAVLARRPLSRRGMRPLPLAALDHPRALQVVDLSLPGGSVRLATTHLTWRLGSESARARQARAIATALGPAGTPVVLGGDLNDVPGSPALQVLADAGFTDCCAPGAEPRPTFDAANRFMWQHELAGRRVDHLLARDLELFDADVVLDGTTGPVVSDHYGVRATVRMRSG